MLWQKAPKGQGALYAALRAVAQCGPLRCLCVLTSTLVCDGVSARTYKAGKGPTRAAYCASDASDSLLT